MPGGWNADTAVSMVPSLPSGGTGESGPPSRTETAAHRELKRLALDWAAARRLVLAATEVRLPRSPYRADVAAATPRALAPNAFTAVFECKVSRADFLRDSAPEAGAAAKIVGRGAVSGVRRL